jgi:hypothetical protein
MAVPSTKRFFGTPLHPPSTWSSTGLTHSPIVSTNLNSRSPEPLLRTRGEAVLCFSVARATFLPPVGAFFALDTGFERFAEGTFADEGSFEDPFADEGAFEGSFADEGTFEGPLAVKGEEPRLEGRVFASMEWCLLRSLFFLWQRHKGREMHASQCAHVPHTQIKRARKSTHDRPPSTHPSPTPLVFQSTRNPVLPVLANLTHSPPSPPVGNRTRNGFRSEKERLAVVERAAIGSLPGGGTGCVAQVRKWGGGVTRVA